MIGLSIFKNEAAVKEELAVKEEIVEAGRALAVLDSLAVELRRKLSDVARVRRQFVSAVGRSSQSPMPAPPPARRAPPTPEVADAVASDTPDASCDAGADDDAEALAAEFLERGQNFEPENLARALSGVIRFKRRHWRKVLVASRGERNRVRKLFGREVAVALFNNNRRQLIASGHAVSDWLPAELK